MTDGPNPLVLSAADTGMFGKNIPGTLTLDSGRMRFETASGVAFDVPVTELAKANFSMGDSVFKVTVQGKKYRFYFGQTVAMNENVGTIEASRGFLDSRQAGKALKEALGLR